jgi:hypothetical protein
MYTIVGKITIILLAIGFAAMMIIMLIGLIDKILDDYHHKVRYRCFMELGGRLTEASWWFSESHEAQTAMHMIGLRMAQGHRIDDLYDARNDWKKQLKEKKDAESNTSPEPNKDSGIIQSQISLSSR